jgi:hypothetical protein
VAFLRWLGLDRNPLRRPTDQVESVLRILLVAVFLSCGPPLAAAAGHLLTAPSRQSWHRVTAVILATAPAASTPRGALATYWVPASWRDRDGGGRTGNAPVRPGTRAGGTVLLWADPAGQLSAAPPPRRVSQTPLLVAAAWAAALASLALGLCMVAGLARCVLDRRRMRAWAAGWTAIEPRWTARR